MGDLDCVDAGGIEGPTDLAYVLDAVAMPDGVHAVAERDVLDVELGGHTAILEAICSAVLSAALVMMSRLPAYGGR